MREPKILPFVFKVLFASGAAMVAAVLTYTDESFGERLLLGCGVLMILIGSGGLQELAWRRSVRSAKQRDLSPGESQADRVNATQNEAEAAE